MWSVSLPLSQVCEHLRACSHQPPSGLPARRSMLDLPDFCTFPPSVVFYALLLLLNTIGVCFDLPNVYYFFPLSLLLASQTVALRSFPFLTTPAKSWGLLVAVSYRVVFVHLVGWLVFKRINVLISPLLLKDSSTGVHNSQLTATFFQLLTLYYSTILWLPSFRHLACSCVNYLSFLSGCFKGLCL